MAVILNQKGDGYRGIWYSNQPIEKDVYKYKYSGGLGTYCAKHQSFAVYSEKVHKTFFCYGGTADKSNQKLTHMISYYDHRTGKVPRPTILLDKKTNDAHDNPVITLDSEGYIWVFSTAHGTARPSYIHRSEKPYSIDRFEIIPAVEEENGKPIPITNFSYMQPWLVSGEGFFYFFTKYRWGSIRTICFSTSKDGINWSRWQRLAFIAQGHYQISAANRQKAATAFNYHPTVKTGLNFRTNLYYLQTPDFGKTWQNAAGEQVKIPLRKVKNPALVYDYEKEGLNVYMKDIKFTSRGQPVILYLTSKGYQPGPENAPRTWTTARWTGKKWDINPVTTSDNNYDTGSLFIEKGGIWRIIAPTETGPQPYNPGGEIVIWTSKDHGRSWKKAKQITEGSKYNHTYVRSVVNRHPDFYALWADGHGRKPSPSRIYFCTRDGKVYRLPEKMVGNFKKPELVSCSI
jgi:hypothetical protein